MLIDFIENLKSQFATSVQTLSEVEISFDSAYCVQKVMQAICDTDLKVITKPNNNHKFEFEGESMTPAELIEKIKDGHWKFLEKDKFYQRVTVYHHRYGEVVLIVRRKKLKNGKIIYDFLSYNSSFYTANRIDKCYSKRWKIELQFKYYKQHLNLGKTHFRKLGAIQSYRNCVAITGLLVAKYCRSLARSINLSSI